MSDSLEFIFERANSALITRDFQYAEHLLINVLKKNPHLSPDDKQKIEDLLARIYVDMGDLKKSLEAYLRLYAQKPTDVEIMNNLGRIYRHLGQFDKSLEILEKAKTIGGLTDEVLYNLAKTYKRMRNYEKAAELFALAIDIKPDHAHAYDRLGNLYVLTGDLDKAIETYKNGLRVDSNHPYLNFHLASVLRKEKRYEEAIVYYNSALRCNPAWDSVLYELANTYLHIDKLDNALQTYRTLLRISGENAPIYTELGHLFERKRLETEAEQYYSAALTVDSSYVPAALALSSLLEKRKAFTESLAVLLAAEAAPSNKNNRELRLKTVEQAIYAKDYAKAHELIQKFDHQYDNDIAVLKLKGQLSALMGDTHAAEKTFEKILQIVPSAIEFRRELAAQYLLADRYDDAKKQLELFVKQKPLDAAALMMLGQTHEALHNPQAAYEAYQKVLEQQPDNIEARSALSHLFQTHGNTIEALKTADEILNLQSTSSNQDVLHGLAETLDLYERAAESYMVDPLLKKNLDNLKTNETDFYIPSSELEQNVSQYNIFPLFEEIQEEEEYEAPLDLLTEQIEEEEILHDEKDEPVDSIQLITKIPDEPEEDQSYSIPAQPYAPAPQYPAPSPLQPEYTAPYPDLVQESDEYINHDDLESTYTTDDSSTAFQPCLSDEIQLQPVHEEPAFDPTELSKILAKSPKPTGQAPGQEAIEKRLQDLDSKDTGLAFLQDIASDLIKEFEEKKYHQVIETLAQKIAENLADKGYIPHTENTELDNRNTLFENQAPDELPLPDTSTASHIDNQTTEDSVALADSTSDTFEPIPIEDGEAAVVDNNTDTIFTELDNLEAPENEPLNTETVNTQYNDDNDIEYNIPEELPSEYMPLADESTTNIDTPTEQEQSESFMLDEDQQNLLWCHAKRKLKDSPCFEEQLDSVDVELLAGLFLYLRDLLVFLPEDKFKAFLSSTERILICYIISRLSGDIGLKERAQLINQMIEENGLPHLHQEKSLVELLEYLRDLTDSLADRELGQRCGMELDNLITHLSSITDEQ